MPDDHVAPSRIRRAWPALLLIVVAPSWAQEPARADSVSAILPDITVTVTRAEEPLSRVPAAVSVLDVDAMRRGQITRTLDEALNNLPGVFVASRRDPRLSIRGSGYRANFGTRGIKFLLDGIPQTLPDGQSALSNVEFGSLERIEVLRGPSSALYGNASGGVVSMFTEAPGSGPVGLQIRTLGGSDGLFKLFGRSDGRSGPLSGNVVVSYTTIDNFRQHSASNGTQANLRGDWQANSSTVASLRFLYNHQPQDQNPGALTYAEYQANPDSAAANNILRKAGADVDQEQLSLSVRHVAANSAAYSVAVFGILRDLAGNLAAPPPQGTGPNVGTHLTLDRRVGGLRLNATNPLSGRTSAPRLTYGLDLQQMHDDRVNFRAVAGVPDTAFLDQTEKVTEVGPFVDLGWSPVAELTFTVGGRYDWVTFDVADHHLTDGVDNSGNRTMHAASGQVGASYRATDALMPYVKVSTSFETPTTTELVNQPGGTGGFNDQLDPQRTVSYEVGARGHVSGRFGYSVAGYLGRVSDAIVQYTEVGGRAYYQNAGKLHTDGVELGLNGEPVRDLQLFASVTWSHYRYDKYRIVRGAVTDTLDGKMLPGLPEWFIRLGLRTRFLAHGALDIDHTMASKFYADDRNTQIVNGWGEKADSMPNGFGMGVTNIRVSWDQPVGAARIAPFLGVTNLWDKQYVGSVSINGAAGRVYEPAAPASIYGGVEIGWAKPGDAP